MDNLKQHYDVLIATPGSSLHAGYVKSLTETINHLNVNGISWKWLNGSSSLVHHAREVLMSGDNTMNADDKGPLHGQCTYNKMIWIDSDIEWSVQDFMKLYNATEDIMCGAYLLANGKTSVIQTERHPGGIPKEEILKMKNICKINSCGFGFVGVKHGVFEKLDRPWFGHLIQIIHNSRGEQLYDSLGEDVSWCIRAKNAGFNIHFDPSILVTHLKTTKVSWN